MDDDREYQPEHEPRHEYPPEHDAGLEYQPEPEHEAGLEYQPELEAGHEYHPELRVGHEYQPELEAGLEYQPENEPGLEYQPEHEDRNEYQPELEVGHEYKPGQEAGEDSDPEEEVGEDDDDDEGAGQEYQLKHEAEQGYQPEHETEEEYQPRNEDEPANEQYQEHEHDNDDDNGTEDGMQENSHPYEKQENAAETEAVGGEKWPGWPGESVFRMLVPAQKVGSIIGRKGEYIKKTCEETRARIKILDGPPGTRERAVMVSAKEEPDVPRPPAIEGLLQVHKRVLDGLENDSSAPAPGSGGKVSTRLLVPAAQAGSLIGKQGTTVKSIQDESSCIVRVLGTDELPVFALQDDRVVEVVGEATGIHKALELIATHLRKFLVDRSIISVIEMQMQTPNPPMDHMPPPPQHWGPPPQSFPTASHGGPGYGSSPRFMPPSRQQQYDNYYPPADMPPPDKQQHQGISAYGREALMPVHSSSAQAPSSVITQVTQQMQIPLSYADAVIGTQGSSISYIRRVSGATVTIQETRGVPTEMTVEISGTASQVQTAQQLIQNSMAEAASSTQQQNPPSAEQMYGSYGSAVYTSPASNPSQSGGGYGSVYGNSYGY